MRLADETITLQYERTVGIAYYKLKEKVRDASILQAEISVGRRRPKPPPGEKYALRRTRAVCITFNITL